MEHHPLSLSSEAAFIHICNNRNASSNQGLSFSLFRIFLYDISGNLLMVRFFCNQYSGDNFVLKTSFFSKLNVQRETICGFSKLLYGFVEATFILHKIAFHRTNLSAEEPHYPLLIRLYQTTFTASMIQERGSLSASPQPC